MEWLAFFCGLIIGWAVATIALGLCRASSFDMPEVEHDGN